MSDEKKGKSILEALDQMEEESAHRTAYKKKVNARIQKHIKPKTEKTTEQRIKEKSDQSMRSAKFDLKARITKYSFIVIILQVIIYKFFTKGDRVEYVFYNIAAACLYVIVKARMK